MKLPLDEALVAKRLLTAVSLKAFVEIVFICVIVSYAALSNFHPSLRGAIDIADTQRVTGWVFDPSAPDTSVEVQLFVDGEFVAVRRADEVRVDLVSAGAAPGPNHGFSFSLNLMRPEPGRHHVQVFAVRDALGRARVLLPVAKAPVTFESQ